MIEKISIGNNCLKNKVHTLLKKYVKKCKNKSNAFNNISVSTNLTTAFLQRFYFNANFEPGVDKIEILYKFLTGKNLGECLNV